MTKKQKREIDLLTELQTKHGYMLLKMPRPADGFTSQFRAKPRRWTTTPAVVMRLCVPRTSALGDAMAKLYEKPRARKRGRP